MPAFKYLARDNVGKKIRGTEDSASTVALFDDLTKRGYTVTKIEPYIAKQARSVSIPFLDRIKGEHIVYFNLELANLLQAGLSLTAALKILVRGTPNRKFQKILLDVARSIEEGKSFSEATQKYPKVFSEVYVSLVKSGETSGKLEIVLSRFAHFMSDQLELQRKIRSAMTYPLILVCMSIVVVILMMTLVVPYFVIIFEKAGIPLPLPTRILNAVGLFVRDQFLVFLGCVIATIVGVRFIKNTPWGRRGYDRIKLKVPVIGTLVKRIVMSRWTRTLSTLIEGGVPIIRALRTSKRVAGNRTVEERIEEASFKVEKGGRIMDAVRGHQEFPEDVVQMIGVGEESGTLDKMLARVADFYDSLIAYQVKRLTDLLEPMFLIAIGGLVVFIMVSVMLPIFDMIDVIQKGGGI